MMRITRMRTHPGHGRLLLILIAASALALARKPDSLFIAPLYVEYTSASSGEFAAEAEKVKERLGRAPGVLVGFSAYLGMRFRQPDLNRTIDEAVMQPTFEDLEGRPHHRFVNGSVQVRLTEAHAQICGKADKHARRPPKPLFYFFRFRGEFAARCGGVLHV